MDQTRLKHFKQVLLERKETLEREIANLTPDQLSTDDEEGLSNHPAEDADMMWTQEQMLAMRLSHQTALDNVNSALLRIKQGTYGKCERCGREITLERLEAMPEASLCIDDQRDLEQ